MTKMEMFAAILPLVAENEELTNAVQHEIDLLAKRKATPAKPDAKTVENAALKLEILAILTATARYMGISEIVEAVEGEYANPVTNGRVSALLTILCKEDKVDRQQDKQRHSLFAIKGE